MECDNVMRRKAEEFRMGKVNSIGGMKPTKLYPVNAKCDSVNSAELEKLTSDSVPFTSVDWGHSPYLENLKVFYHSFICHVLIHVRLLVCSSRPRVKPLRN